VVIHHPAGQTPDGDPTDRLEVAQFLRNIQTAYVRDRGYSIGYSFAIDWRGDVWECRGWDLQPAANAGHNDHTLALLLIVDENQPATAAQLTTAREYAGELERRHGAPIVVTGHGQLRGAATACPGTGMREQIAAGLFDPDHTDPAPPEEIPVMLARRVRVRGTKNVFLINAGGPPLNLTPELDHVYREVPLEVVDWHDQFVHTICYQTGLEPEDLLLLPEGV
jgi:hypothetical protein